MGARAVCLRARRSTTEWPLWASVSLRARAWKSCREILTGPHRKNEWPLHSWGQPEVNLRSQSISVKYPMRKHPVQYLAVVSAQSLFSLGLVFWKTDLPSYPLDFREINFRSINPRWSLSPTGPRRHWYSVSLSLEKGPRKTGSFLSWELSCLAQKLAHPRLSWKG